MIPPGSAGTFALRRLNREEFDRTMRDVLLVSDGLGDTLPVDGTSGGFDNAAAALTASPLWYALAQDAAARLATEVTRPPAAAAVDLDLLDGSAWIADRTVFEPDGGALLPLTLPEAQRGERRVALTLRALSTPNGTMTWALYGSRLLGSGTLEEGPSPVTVEVTADFDAADRQLSLALDIGPWPGGAHPQVELLEARLLSSTDRANAAFERLVTCDLTVAEPLSCVEQILRPLLRRAWRRLPTDAEVARLLVLYERERAALTAELDTPTEIVPYDALAAVVEAVLSSPHLLLVPERAATPGDATPIDRFELATRLSYFLWSSAPDDALLDAAEDGSLSDPERFASEVDRMLDDPRADALTDRLASQWLGIDRLEQAAPEPSIFPDFNDDLRASMREEMRAFFETFLRAERPVAELLSGNESWSDADLAAFLGLPVPESAPPWSAPGRGGWLAQAGLLTALSPATRTSPVKRGAWVLTNLLCAEPEPPPPGVATIAEGTGDSMREIMAQHRANPGCASCHDAIDPIGLAMEDFDAVGRERHDEGGRPIDARATLAADGMRGVTVDGLLDLQHKLAATPAFYGCVVEKVFSFAHHRLPEPTDLEALALAADRSKREGATFRAVVRSVVLAETFQAREATP